MGGLLDHCKYKYLAFLNGNTYSSRLKFNLLCGSVVFASEARWEEWWTGQLSSSEYVRVADDWSDAGLLFEKTRVSVDRGEAIGSRGRKFAVKTLNPYNVDCYWRRLIENAHAYLPREPLSSKAKPVEDVLLYEPQVAIGEEGII